MKKLAVGALALSLLLGGVYSYSAFASSNERSVKGSLKAEVKTPSYDIAPCIVCRINKYA
ncbi:hypothetical protein LAV72_02015 [Lysinibacillus xylanilyticus]|uniref:hypothetical protein n=1 Tax=Lysinibacillus xylanilyticus TaxID=582475 RepID=UPI002B24C9E4|nr:hypothetical protein [Lysinibacillus xylanilyticus]MEB2298404.1 hypothetical protein [Lysinibacillus xylanilyticus]